MQGSRENPILVDDASPVKLVITECSLLPRHFGQYAQKELERYCRLHQKGKAIQLKLDELARQQYRHLYSPDRTEELYVKSTSSHRILNRIFKEKLAIFERAYDEGWASFLPDSGELDLEAPPRTPQPEAITPYNKG